MKKDFLTMLCDPKSRKPLQLAEGEPDQAGDIREGMLVSPDKEKYPVRNGIPRFIPEAKLKKSVESFGDEWNFFNFVDFKVGWLKHVVGNTFGSLEAFKGKTIVDAGAGSGAQTLWMLEAGAKKVISIELSHSVDDIIQRNLKPSGFSNYEVIQGSIDCPPIRDESVDMVYCHNVIQHTPSVEKTARALFRLVKPGGELVFNCYPLDIPGFLRWSRFYLIYKPLRRLFSRLPFRALLFYSKCMGFLRLVPFLGWFLEKASFCNCGEVCTDKKGLIEYMKKQWAATVLNTFDAYGSHAFQHHKTEGEIRALVSELQPDPTKVLNMDRYYQRPPPIGIALRVFK